MVAAALEVVVTAELVVCLFSTGAGLGRGGWRQSTTLAAVMVLGQTVRVTTKVDVAS